MRSRRAAAGLLLAGVVAFAALNVVETVRRSWIPSAVDGTVESIQVRTEKNPGVDDVWLVTVDGDTDHVDAEVGRRLAEGDMVSKAAGATTLQVNGRAVPLQLSRDARGMLVVMPLVVVLAAMASRATRPPR